MSASDAIATPTVVAEKSVAAPAPTANIGAATSSSSEPVSTTNIQVL
jgi:hypothetical protein